MYTFCIRFIDIMLNAKSLVEYINLFSPNDYKKNGEIMLNFNKKDSQLYLCI